MIKGWSCKVEVSLLYRNEEEDLQYLRKIRQCGVLREMILTPLVLFF